MSFVFGGYGSEVLLVQGNSAGIVGDQLRLDADRLTHILEDLPSLLRQPHTLVLRFLYGRQVFQPVTLCEGLHREDQGVGEVFLFPAHGAGKA